MRHDKKVLAGQMRFILARGIGDAFVTAEVDESHVKRIIERSLASDQLSLFCLQEHQATWTRPVP